MAYLADKPTDLRVSAASRTQNYAIASARDARSYVWGTFIAKRRPKRLKAMEDSSSRYCRASKKNVIRCGFRQKSRSDTPLVAWEAMNDYRWIALVDSLLDSSPNIGAATKTAG
jgi:hypothetical protein